ncbi:MAG: DeoR/GlpR family DNA-binding transcription regulator [Anaerolineales bacterium]|nr:DeoR/GlpR family DNA-binding transcription regulator [Anaerolineales bacterium]
MKSIDRKSQIVEMVMGRGNISIADICSRFNISDMTARRDLNELDRQGLLRRVHGGAIANLGRSYEPSFQTRAVKNKEAKAAIGRKAAELIYDGDSIALDVGTTTLEIVQGLKGKRNLTIVTSCLQIAGMIVDQISLEVDARLIITGGIVRPRELSMVGHIPEQVYHDLHVDKAFIGIGGVSLEDGLTEYNIEDTQIKRMLIRSAQEKIVVADGAKFGVTTFTSVAPLTAVDKIVTDGSAPPEVLEKVRERGVEVILAD